MPVKSSLRVVKNVDNGFTQFFRTMKRWGQLKGKVGVQGVEAQVMNGDVTNVFIAVVHEFGAPKANIPQRSFLRSTADKERKKIDRFLKIGVEDSLRKVSITEVRSSLLKAGEFLRKSIITRMSVNEFGRVTPLATSTIASKGGDTTALVETGDLKGAISVVVE
jgi:hypothetical protein